MKKEIISFAKSALSWSSKHSGAILSGMAVTGLVTTVVLAVKATADSIEDINAEELKRYDEAKDCVTNEKGEVIEHRPELLTLTNEEKFKLCWRNYIPTCLSGAMTMGCILGAHHADMRVNAALASAYAMSEAALKDLKAKTVEHIGEKKFQKITDDIVKDKVDAHPVNSTEVLLPSTGETLFFDTISGRYFKHDIQTVRSIINDLNQELIDDMYLCLNDLYYSIGLPRVEIGDDIGWNIGKEGKIDIEFVAQKASNGEPCLALVYSVGPRFNYGELY